MIRAKLTDPSKPFVILAELEAQPGQGDALAAAVAATQAVRISQAEPGCLAYDLCRDADAPDRFVMVERWRDLAALAEHLATPHFAAVGAALEGLLAKAPAVRVLVPA
jgi:quinol monooxygenase YgiN